MNRFDFLLIFFAILIFVCSLAQFAVSTIHISTLDNDIGLDVLLSRKTTRAQSDDVISEREKSAVSTKDTPKIAIFFNTFSTNDTKLSSEIINEQYKAINRQPLLSQSNIYYSRLGNSTGDFRLKRCTNLNSRKCIKLTEQAKGDELVTLVPMYDFCKENPNFTVMYIHSKGTLSQNFKNNRLRDILMKAVTSKECLDLPKDGSCDTCSTQFTYFPVPSYAGNMFTARCSYVNKLIHPQKFIQEKERVINQMKSEITKVDDSQLWLKTKLYNDTEYSFRIELMKRLNPETSSVSWLGLGRYAAEHWLASHPHVKPCHVFSLQEGNPEIIYQHTFKLGLFKDAKLTKISDEMSKEYSERYWKWKARFVTHPWYSRDGKLYEYKKLYEAIPKADSWFFTFWSGFKINDPDWDFSSVNVENKLKDFVRWHSDQDENERKMK